MDLLSTSGETLKPFSGPQVVGFEAIWRSAETLSCQRALKLGHSDPKNAQSQLCIPMIRAATTSMIK
jgi:hypothetical protein